MKFLGKNFRNRANDGAASSFALNPPASVARLAGSDAPPGGSAARPNRPDNRPRSSAACLNRPDASPRSSAACLNGSDVRPGRSDTLKFFKNPYFPQISLIRPSTTRSRRVAAGQGEGVSTINHQPKKPSANYGQKTVRSQILGCLRQMA
jgi:hypothetical protein